jgi:TonB family protein
MKSFTLIFCILFSASSFFAQTADKTTVVANVNYSSPESLSNVTSMEFKQKAAIKEISTHIKKKLRIPARVKEFNVKGQTLVSVEIDKTGLIKEVKVIESINSSLDKAIIKTIKQMKKIETKGIHNVIQLPVVIN